MGRGPHQGNWGLSGPQFLQGEGSGYGRRLGGEGARPGPKWIFGFFPLKLETPGLGILPSTTGLTAGAYKTWGWVEVVVSAWGATACPPAPRPRDVSWALGAGVTSLGLNFPVWRMGL